MSKVITRYFRAYWRAISNSEDNKSLQITKTKKTDKKRILGWKYKTRKNKKEIKRNHITRMVISHNEK